MTKIEFIEHEQIEEKQLKQIVALKMQHWPYTVDEQKKWISLNLNDNDIHICIYQKRALIAYLNLAVVNMEIDGENVPTYGIGNVCVDKRYNGLGWGKLLMASANLYLKEKKRVGVLLCKEKLLPFYMQSGWKLVNKQEVSIYIKESKFENFCMLYNGKTPLENICLDRNF